jgi:S-ribosylhomocysteine lyase LuxS involved in autoinducer biosynthesis
MNTEQLFSSAILAAKHAHYAAEQEETMHYGSMTMLNRSGDITIAWDEQNKEQIIAMIKKKMAEGYTFFTSKKVPLVNLYRRTKVTEKNLIKCESVIIDDATFEKMVASTDDEDVVKIVRDSKGRFAKPKKNADTTRMIERDPEKIAASDSLAVRRIAGG